MVNNIDVISGLLLILEHTQIARRRIAMVKRGKGNENAYFVVGSIRLVDF